MVIDMSQGMAAGITREVWDVWRSGEACKEAGGIVRFGKEDWGSDQRVLNVGMVVKILWVAKSLRCWGTG
jgi:hypothetical protein